MMSFIRTVLLYTTAFFATVILGLAVIIAALLGVGTSRAAFMTMFQAGGPRRFSLPSESGYASTAWRTSTVVSPTFLRPTT